MKQLCKRSLALLMVLVMVVGLLPAITVQTDAASYTYNWGTRGTVADEDDFTRSTAEEWYAARGTSYEELSQLLGSATSSAVPTSEMYRELRSLMSGAATKTTSYESIKTLCQYTDCQNGGGKISSFYSGKAIGPSWDGTWNREHTWPNSKGDNNGSGENDIFMLRPTSESENSSRGNEAYGESGSYYHPNVESGGKYDLRGDVVRIIMFVYVRWQNISSGTGVLYGTGGVIENRDVMLKWMKEDPVDTWELGRNDACQSITGTRNVFVDYPELGFLLFGADVPDNYTSPSGQGNSVSYNITATSNNTSYGTVSVSGKTITASPKSGYYASGYTVTSGSATVTQNGNTFIVNASSNCTVRINFAARQKVTVSFAGADVASITGYSGDVMTLPTVTAPEGYTFLGWMNTKLTEDTTTKPNCFMSFTPTASTTLYALYSYVEESSGGGTGDYVKVKTAPADWSGEYLIVNEEKSVIFDGSLTTFDKSGNVKAVTISNHTISAAAGDPYKFTVVPYSNGYSFQGASGKYFGGASAKNSLDTSSTAVVNTISLDASGNAVIKGTGGYVLRYNSGDNRFRYYSNTQAVIALYVKDGSAGVTYYTSDPIKCEHTDTTNTPAVAATCTTSGYTAGVYCNDCESYISGHKVVAALGHSYDSGKITTVPTCTANGVKTFTCGTCGATKTESVAATGHSYNAVVTAPTTYEQGYTTYTCSACGHSYVSDYVEALGETYIVKFSVPSDVEAVSNMECGKTGITLPAAGIPTGEYTYTFAGWATEAVEETEEAPTLYKAGETFTATGATTLYAVYSYVIPSEDGGNGDYVKVTEAPDDWSGEYVIVYESGSVILDSSRTTLDDNNNTQSVTITNNTISADDGDPYQVIIAKVDGGYSIKTASEYYIGATSNSNSLNSNKSTVYTNTLSMNNDGSVDVIGSGGAYLRYNTSASRFRYYKSSTYTGQKAIALYVKSGSAGTTCYTSLDAYECKHDEELAVEVAPTLTQHGYIQYVCADCGEELYEEDVLPAYEMNWNMTLKSDLSVNFQIGVHEALQETLQIQVSFDGKTDTYVGSCTASVQVAAAQMADEITIIFTLGKETETKTYTVKQYAHAILADAAKSQYHQIVKDMLSYGAAAQTYFDYNAGNLVNGNIIGAGTAEVPSAAGSDVVVSGEVTGVTFYGATLLYRNKLAVRFYFTVSGNIADYTFKVGETAYEPVLKDGKYYVEIGDINPQDWDKSVTVVVNDVLSVSYSPMNYIVRMNQKGNDTLKALLKAMYNYHLAAKAVAEA